MAWHLQTLRGRERGQVRTLSKGVTILGRGSDCDTVIQSDLVSRVHAQLTVGDDVRATDLGSSNGTYVNGARVLGDAVVGPNDVLLVGDAAYRLHASLPPLLSSSGWVDAIRPAPGVGINMSGSLVEVPPATVLRYFGVTKKSGTLMLSSPPLQGQISFARGHIREVLVGGRKTRDPIQALTAILRWRGLFELDPTFDESAAGPLLGLDAVLPAIGSNARPSMYPR